MTGIYIHIPFCAKKCAYCNFYSACTESSVVENYMQALYREIEKWGGSLGRPVKTLYIGGGTPSVLGKKIATLVNKVKDNFTLTADCEITVEMNPTGDCEEFLYAAKRCGVNRLSVGAQSANDDELTLLGRTHGATDIKYCVSAARQVGFKNISLDLMLGLPESNIKTLESSLDFITALNVEHISAYILKIEEKTALAFNKKLCFLDEDKQAEQYLFTCDYLNQKGYSHYEISNFAKQGFEGRHNKGYWKCEEYLGIGAAAHSFLKGERFYYKADIKSFCEKPEIIKDGTGGDAEEFFMLGLRLKEGLDLKAFEKKFSLCLPQRFFGFIRLLEKEKLLELNNGKLSLTDKGMLVSNTVITELLERIV